MFSLADYDFELPAELIAQSAVEPRDSSRLMVVDRRHSSISHHHFRDLPKFLDSLDLLIANDTRVIPARLLGQRLTEEGLLAGRIEFLMLEELSPQVWEGAFRAAAKHKPGVKFFVPTPDGLGVRGELIRGASESEQGTVVVRFDRDPVSSGAGVMPLPPYIERSAVEGDQDRYQTVYSKELGSAAAPTAGLHFTERLQEELRGRGVGWQTVTLHVGLGTFRPVKTSDIREHLMHEERYTISAEVARQVTDCKAKGGRVVAVGTTSVRTLESSWNPEARALQAGAGRTRIFIHPGGQSISLVDRLITNFHLPRSTLLMMVSAFAGRELIAEAYRTAVRERYRFFSYGDAMLIL